MINDRLSGIDKDYHRRGRECKIFEYLQRERSIEDDENHWRT